MKEDSDYTALISPDTYEYLDKLKPEDFIYDPLLEEQEEREYSFLPDEEDEEPSDNLQDDSDAYKSDLFSIEDKEDIEDKESEIPLTEQICSFCKDADNAILKYIQNCSSENLYDLSDTISRARDAFMQDKKDKVFFIPETDISVAVVRTRTDPMIETQRKIFIASEMVLREKNLLNVLFLEFSSDGSLANAGFETVSKASFSEGEWKIIMSLAQRRNV